MLKRVYFLSYCFLMIILSSLAQGETLQLHATFLDRAYISIDGKARLLRRGQTMKEGLTLIRVNKRSVDLDWQGKRQTLALSQGINSTFSQNAQIEVALQKRNNRAYVSKAKINGRGAKVVLDTGATVVAMSGNTAKALGIDYLGGERGSVMTASAVVAAYFVNLTSVSVGGIAVSNVRASVVEGRYPSEILLGMSYLRHVSLHEQQGVMYLRAKY